jgi:hypothetical protein
MNVNNTNILSGWVNSHIYIQIPNKWGIFFLNRMSLSAGVNQTEAVVLQDVSPSFILQFKIHNYLASEAT